MVLWIVATGLVVADGDGGDGDENGRVNGDGNGDRVNGVARARSAVEVTFMAGQFCAMVVVSVYACSRATERKVGCAYYNVRNPIPETHDRPPPSLKPNSKFQKY